MLWSFSDGDSDGDCDGDHTRDGDNHGDGDGGGGGGGGDCGDGHGDGGVCDVSNHLTQFSVPTDTHPAHVRAAHSAVQDDPLYSALSQIADLAGML